MPIDRLEVKVSLTKLLLAMVIVIVPLSILGLVLTERSDRTLDNSVGNDFKTMAQLYSDQVSQFITERISDVKTLAANPTVVSAVTGGSHAASKNGHTPAVSANAAQTTGPAGSGLLTSGASQLLRLRKDLDPRLLSATITDATGEVIAASQKPNNSSLAHNEFWQSAFNAGQGSIKISNILYDSFTKSYYVNIAAPVLAAGTNAAAGVLNAAVSLNDLLSQFQKPVGNGARAVLVNEKGIIVSSQSADIFANKKSQEFDAVRDSLGSTEGKQNGWTLADLSGGSRLVGYAATGLKQNFENLGWIVMVSQEEAIAAAPVRGLEHFALLMVILSLFMLTLLCVYWFLHRSQRLEDIEDVLPSRQGKATAASF